MKKCHFIVLLFISFFIFSCSKKDAELSPQNETPVPDQQKAIKQDFRQLTNKLFDRAIKVYDARNISSATIHFRSSSKELLASMPLENFEFTLVKTPAPSGTNAKEVATSMNDGKANFSRGSTDQVISTANRLQESKKVIYVNFETDAKNPSVSVEVKSKTFKNSSGISPAPHTLWPAGTQVFFYGAYDRHRVQIDNLSSDPLDVDFYYDSCEGGICSTNGDLKGTFTKWSGYSFTLYLNGWAWYYNCNKGVGALLTVAPGNSYWFRWTLWSNCTP